MAVPQAGARVDARPERRAKLRRRARRERRLVALTVFAAVAIVVIALSAFGTGDSASPLAAKGPAPSTRLLPAGPPQPQVVARHDALRILLPVNQRRLTAIGYHGAGAGTLPLEPVGTQANAGLFERLARRLFGTGDSGPPYFVIEGGAGPATSGLDVGAPVETDVYSPVDGTVIAIADRIVDGGRYGVTIDVQPSGSPDLVVSVSNIEPDPALTVGSSVSAARTKVGHVIDLSGVETAALADFTQDDGQHVSISVRPAATLAAP